jgi:hypothetical protein
MNKTPQSPKKAVAGSSKSKVAKSAKKPANQVPDPLDSGKPLKKKQAFSRMGSFEYLGREADFPPADKVALLAAILYSKSADGVVEEAVRTALRIYECYYHWMDKDRQVFYKIDEEAPMRYGRETFTFAQAIIKITGQVGRLNRAREYFEEFTIDRINSSPDLKTRQAREHYFNNLKAYQTESCISAREVMLLESTFATYFKEHRKKSKKKS